MMKNDVKIQQIALILLLVIPGGKYLSLPAILSQQVRHDSWLVLIISFLFDAVALCFLLWAIKMNTENLSLNEILSRTIGKIGAKIVFAVFFVLFMSRVLLLLSSCYKLFAVTFTVKTNWPAFVIPIALVGFFIVSRGFQAIARTNQLLFVLVMLSVISIMVFPATKVDFAELMPVAEDGWGKVFKTALVNGFWFSDFVFMFFLLGDIRKEKKVFSPVLICFAIGASLAVVMNMVFILLYGDTAAFTDLAMSKISLFSLTESTNGRWDWLSLSIWVMSVFIKMYIFMFCAYKCVEYIIGTHESKFNIWIAVGITAVMFVPMFISAENILKKFIRYAYYPFAVLQYLLPLLLPLLVRIASRKTPGKLLTAKENQT